jgi:hypothetical protein
VVLHTPQVVVTLEQVAVIPLEMLPIVRVVQEVEVVQQLRQETMELPERLTALESAVLD